MSRRSRVPSETGATRVKHGMAHMLKKGGVIVDVVTPEQAASPRRPGRWASWLPNASPADLRRDVRVRGATSLG